MPSAQIDNEVFLHYEDSGPPAGNSHYTTVVAIHGVAFNGSTFIPMFAHASQHNLRIIAVNMRDYSGSTPYNQEELAELSEKDIEVQTRAVRRLGDEIASFLVFVCATLGVPTVVTRGRQRSGGIVLMTWSLSTMAFMSMFGDREVLSQDTKSILSSYLRTVIVYDAPCLAYGVHPEIGLLHAFSDDSIPWPEKPAAFLSWITAYYTAIRDESPRTITPETLRARTASGTPTVYAIPPHEFKRMVEPGVVLCSGALLAMGTNPDIHQRNTHNTFFDAADTLPEVDVVAFWCDRSAWNPVWGAKVLDDICQQDPVPGKCKRHISFLKIKDANHLYHWDEPEQMVRLLANTVQSSASVSANL